MWCWIMPDVGSAQRELGPVQTKNEIIWPPGLRPAQMRCDQMRMMAGRADIGGSRSQVRAERSIKDGVSNPKALNTGADAVASGVSPRNE